MHSIRSRSRWWFAFGMMLALAVMAVTFGGLGLKLRSELNAQEERLTRVEVGEVAQRTAERTSAVAQCFASARARPKLLMVLEAIADSIDPADRPVVEDVIRTYRESSPTLPDCEKRAREAGLDPDAFAQRGEARRP